MSWRGQMLKSGISSDGSNIDVFRGTVTARNVFNPFGNVYYVNKGMATSGAGTSWTTAYKTIAEAITVTNARIDWAASPWAKSDVIIIAPGSYDENLTAVPYGCIMIGAEFDMKDGQIGVKIAPSSGSPIDVASAVNISFYNIGFHSTGANPVFDAEILNNVLFHGCYFTGPVETSTAAAGIVSKDSVKLHVIDSIISCCDKGIDINYADANDSFSHALIKGTIFDQIDTAGIEISTNLVGPSSRVIDCYFFGGGVTMGYAINDLSGILDVAKCFAESTNGFSNCRSVNGSYNNGSLVT